MDRKWNSLMRQIMQTIPYNSLYIIEERYKMDFFFPGHTHMTLMYVSYFRYLKTCQVLLIFPKNGSWSTQKSKRAPKVHRINHAPWNNFPWNWKWAKVEHYHQIMQYWWSNSTKAFMQSTLWLIRSKWNKAISPWSYTNYCPHSPNYFLKNPMAPYFIFNWKMYQNKYCGHKLS